MYDNDHLDEQWLRQPPLPRRRSGAGCGLTLLLGAVSGAYPAYQAAGLRPVDALRAE